MDIEAFDDDITAFLVSVDDLALTADFLATMGAVTPCLLDEDRLLYDSYDTDETGRDETPFPLRVVIDREGVTRWLDNSIDNEALHDAVADALAR